MRLSVVLPSGDPSGGARLCRGLERMGVDAVWVPESYGFDAPTLLGYLAAQTERVELGFGILPVFSRTPALVAMTAAGLDAVSNGRCLLGLGASGPQVIEGWHGVPYDRPLARTRDVVTICRAIWKRDGPVGYSGDTWSVPLDPSSGRGLKLLPHPRRERIPVFLASLGPKGVELAAEIAEGWFPTLFIPEKAAEVFAGPLAAGLARRPDDLPPLDVCAGGLVAIGSEDGVAPARAAVRAATARFVGGMGPRGRNFYNALVRRYGYEREATEIQEHFLSGRHDAAARAVPEALVEQTSLCGSEGYVKDRLAVLAEAGVTTLRVSLFGPEPEAVAGRLKEWMA